VDRQDVPGALDAFTDGVERRIDVGEADGRIFLTNVSLGVYGEAVRQAVYRDAKVPHPGADGAKGAWSWWAHSGAARHRRQRT
jgi:diacylglycerol kinase family enzyme